VEEPACPGSKCNFLHSYFIPVLNSNLVMRLFWSRSYGSEFSCHCGWTPPWLFPIREVKGHPAATGSDVPVERDTRPRADLTMPLKDKGTHCEAKTKQNHQDAEMRLNKKVN
jgi:hypothetical protein